ncbi:MAG: hypothetical protein V1696_01015 [Candidatus Jorgensenbacteria bacterium]
MWKKYSRKSREIPDASRIKLSGIEPESKRRATCGENAIADIPRIIIKAIGVQVPHAIVGVPVRVRRNRR